MSTATGPGTRPAARQARGRTSDLRGSDTVRATVVAVSAVVGVVGGFLGFGAVVGTPIAEAAGGALSASATLVAPGSPAFTIWSAIYAGLVALAAFQLLPRERSDARQRQVGWWVAASLLLNAAWILTVQAGSVLGSQVIIVALVAVLVVAFARLLGSRPSSTVQAVLLDGVIGLYLGWVSIATVAGAAATLVDAAGWGAVGAAATFWALLVLVIAALIGMALAVVGRGRLAPAASLAWGLAWIAAARLGAEPESVVVGVVAASASGAVVISVVVARVHVMRDSRR